MAKVPDNHTKTINDKKEKANLIVGVFQEIPLSLGIGNEAVQ